VFPTAPRFNPIVLPKVLPFSPIWLGQRGEAPLPFQKNFYFGGLQKFQLFFAMDQSNWLIAKKKDGLVRHNPQLNNVKQDKYSQKKGHPKLY
jgi:hypothetical protein